MPDGPTVNAVRESALWVLGALGLVMLVALVTYDSRDPGFSHTGDGASVRNEIGSGGAWFADIAYSWFGAPAYLIPMMTALIGWLAFSARRLPGPMDRAVLLTRFAGFLLTLFTSCALATLHFAGGMLPQSAGGAIGELIGANLAGALGSVGATLMLLAFWLAGVSVFTGVSWFLVMDQTGRLVLTGVDRVRGLLRTTRERTQMKQAQEQRQEVVRAERKKVARKTPPRIEPVMASAEPSARVEQERQVQLFEQPVAGELPPLSLLDEPPPHGPGYSTEALEAMSRLVELKLRDFGVEVEVVSVHPGPVVTRFELAPAPGVKVSQISGLAKDLARSLSAISVRVVEIIPGKSTVGLEIPNESRELVTLGRHPAVQGVRGDAFAAHARARQGHQRQVRGGRSAADAASPHRRHDRFGQVGRHQRDGAEPRLQGEAGRGPPHHGRPEDARAVGLPGHPAPALPGGHGHEGRGQCTALVRRGDGSPLPPHGRARRAQHRRLQPQRSAPPSRRARSFWIRCR